jgi:hypothetical protein
LLLARLARVQWARARSGQAVNELAAVPHGTGSGSSFVEAGQADRLSARQWLGQSTNRLGQARHAVRQSGGKLESIRRGQPNASDPKLCFNILTFVVWVSVSMGLLGAI